MEQSCEFCKEIEKKPSYFSNIYSSILKERTLLETLNFWVAPTIGQITENSLLLLPKRHFETFAEVPSKYWPEIVDLLSIIEDAYNTKMIYFEHGSKSHTGSSCGVYHAHIHIIPLNKPFDSQVLMGNNAQKKASIFECFNSLADADNYILLKDISGNYYYNTFSEENNHLFKSQYFRKWLANHIQGDVEWDWKKYNYIEQNLLNSVQEFQAPINLSK